jgi:hypothetical protein
MKNTVNDVINALTTLRRFVGPAQISVLGDACRGEEREWFKQKMVELAAQFDAMPKTYEQEGKGDEAIVHLHYFSPSADWYITERDVEPVQHQAFGLADLFGDGGELGYISIVELIRNRVELDLHWTPRTLAQVRAKATA